MSEPEAKSVSDTAEISAVSNATGAKQDWKFQKLNGWRRMIRSLVFMIILLSVTFTTVVGVWGVWDPTQKDAASKGLATSFVIAAGGTALVATMMITDHIEQQY
jgi:hypothetical protein